MFVVVQMHQSRTWDCCKFGHDIEISRSLKFDGADKAPHRSGRKPFADEREQALRIAGDIRDQPVDAAKTLWPEREGALATVGHAGQARDVRIERCLIDAEHPRAE